MYLKHWGFKEKPFENTPDPRFLYMTANHEEAFMRMYYCIEESKGAALLTGEYGSGKTVLTRALLKELLKNEEKYKVALIVNPSFSSHDLFREIIYQLENVFTKGSKLELIHHLNEILYKSMNENKKIVVIIDEAQAMENENMFEEVRLLLNFQMNDKFLLTLILVGQPDLRKKIDNLPQLKQRFGIVYHLNRLSGGDVPKYIDYRCNVAGGNGGIFSEEAVKLIAARADYLPRKINTICELSLLQGMFDNRKIIDSETLEKVLEEIYI